MREQHDIPALKPKAVRVQWLCFVAERILKTNDLSNMEVLTAGFYSTERHPHVTAATQALRNLRLLGLDQSTNARLRNAVADCIDYETENASSPDYIEPPYHIEPNPPYRFRRRVHETDPVISAMGAYLDRPIPFRRKPSEFAETSRPARIVTDQEQALSIDIDLSVATGKIPAPPVHDLSRRPSGDITIKFSDLVELAKELDDLDRERGENNPGNWLARLLHTDTGERKFDILSAQVTGLTAVEDIKLSGLQHMIGLPGAGKTTLVQLMLIWLDRNDFRAAVMLPSIEASLNMIAVLERYSASVGLLVGQSNDTKRRHAKKLAERIAAMDEREGFGVSGPGAGLLAYNCALDGFRGGTHQDHVEFRHDRPPCTDLRQKKIKKDGSPYADESHLLCPMSGWCGRMRSPRELAEKRIWIGHILSTMPRVLPHFLEEGEMIRYVDLISRTMDLVIIDEADGAQTTLDSQSVTALKLTGDKNSLEDRLNKDVTARFIQGKNAIITSNFANYQSAINRFNGFNSNLVRLIQSDRKNSRYDKVLTQTYPNRFVTSSTVLGELFLPENRSALPEEDREKTERRLDIIRKWWDLTVEEAMKDPSGAVRSFERDMTPIAGVSGKDETTARETSYRLKDLLRFWIASERITDRNELLEQIRTVLFDFLPAADHLPPVHRNGHLDMLVGITTVIMQYNIITLAQQAMVAEGVHDRPLDDGRPPEDIARLLPESLVGRLAGVKISFSSEDNRPDTLELQYLNFRSVPRLLMYHWHRLNRHEGLQGPNVLLTSATSFLEESPSYHIPVGPDYVLRRTSQQSEWRDSSFKFMPIRHPYDNGSFLKFSGVKGGQEARREALEMMADHFYSGDNPLVAEMTMDFAPGRRVAFVVNSYEQVHWIKEHLTAKYPHIAKRTIGVSNEIPENNSGDWVVSAQVEAIGRRDDWDAIIFPMRALSRGVNIVFPEGPNKNNAVLGTVVFLTRPHPSSDNFDFVTGMVGRQSMEFDLNETLANLPNVNAIAKEWRDQRAQANFITSSLLRMAISVNRLGKMSEPFVADIMVEILQTIGRAMRNGVKCRAIFVDAAWAPNSAMGKNDTAFTSMLVSVMKILERRLTTGPGVEREIYKAMYEPFLLPLKNCANLNMSS